MRTTVDGLTVRAIATTVPQDVLQIASLSEEFGGRNTERVIASSGIPETLANHGLTHDAVGQFVFHQANQFVVDSVARSLELSPDQAPLLVERFGNTSSASIPMTLCQKFGQTLSNGANDILRRTMLIGFGVGLFWGTALLDLSETSILPVEDLAV